jgi:PAS domain S-box-containing protein
MLTLSKGTKWFSGAGLILATYILAGKLGLLLAILQPNATAVWAPTGLAIAVFLVFGYKFWPAIFLGAFLTNLTTAGTVLTSLGIATGNTLEGLVAAYLVARFARGTQAFERSRDVLRYSFLAGILSTAISATFGVTSLSLAGFSAWADYPAVWLTWWLGDIGGALIVAPFLILWLTNYRVRWNRYKAAETALLVLVLLVFGYFVVVQKFGFLFIFMTPIFIWVAFRFDQRTMATVMLGMTEMYVIELLLTQGPAAGGSALNLSLILLQAFMATTFVTMMALTSVIAEQGEDEEKVMAYNEWVTGEKAQDEAILASIGDGLIVTDLDGRVVLMNPQAESMSGWAMHDVIGKRVTDIIPIEDAKGNLVPIEERPLVKALAHGKTTSTAGVVTYYYVRKNRSKFPVALTATPIVIDGHISGAIDLVKDITIEDEVDRAKNDFISIAAHQLRTPLSSIKWMIELLLDSKLTEAQRKKLTNVYESNERLINVVRNLLSITRIEGGKVKITAEKLEIKGLVADTVKLCERDAAQKKLKFTFDRNAVPHMVSVDRVLFTEALKNILDNAIVYAPEGSSIGVSVEERNGSCEIAVTDEGAPIAESDRANLFKKFYRGAQASLVRPSGSGLGLYISKLNIEVMGGSISFDSPLSEGRGVVFRLRVPMPDPAA